MFAAKTQSNAEGDKVIKPAPVSAGEQGRSSPGTFSGALLQRQADCACGGGCPRCEAASPVQAKLAVSQPGDIYEQEADRVAEQVTRMPGRVVQRACGACAKGGACAECGAGGLVQLKAAGGAGRAASVADDFVRDLGQGQPLDAATRGFYESRFGHDFGHVRLHTDARAAASARSINAQAYTVGRDIVFGAGRYAPGTSGGAVLLAHELTHVVQQTGAGRSRAPGLSVQRQAADDADADDADARKVVVGNPRIDVRAQFALLRLLRGPADDAATAREIIDQIKKDTLKGIYGDDLKKSADMAAQRGKPRWELVPPGEDAIWLEDGLLDAPAMIFKESAGGPPRLDRALIKAYRADPAVVRAQCPDGQGVPPGCAFSETEKQALKDRLEDARNRTREVSQLLTRPGGGQIATTVAADAFDSSDSMPLPTLAEITSAVNGTLGILESSIIRFACRTCGDPKCKQGTVAYVINAGQMPVFICAFRLFTPLFIGQLRRTIIHEAVHLSGIDTDTSKDEEYCERVPECGGPCHGKDNAETWARYIDCLGVPLTIPPPRSPADRPTPPRPATLPGLGEP